MFPPRKFSGEEKETGGEEEERWGKKVGLNFSVFLLNTELSRCAFSTFYLPQIQEGRRVQSEAEPENKVGVKGMCFQICSCFLSFYSVINWQYIKLISPRQACFACVDNWWVISESLSQPTSFLSYFLLPSRWVGWLIQWLGWHLVWTHCKCIWRAIVGRPVQSLKTQNILQIAFSSYL